VAGRADHRVADVFFLTERGIVDLQSGSPRRLSQCERRDGDPCLGDAGCLHVRGTKGNTMVLVVGTSVVTYHCDDGCGRPVRRPADQDKQCLPRFSI